VKSAKDSLLSLHRTTADAKRFDAHDILPFWMAAVGREVGQRTRPTYLANGRLTVEVDAAEWREQLVALSGTILARLNKLLAQPKVEWIDYRLARPPRRRPARAESAASPADSCDEALGIQDPQLRRLYRVSMKRSR
jgi:hypothetical protein